MPKAKCDGCKGAGGRLGRCCNPVLLPDVAWKLATNPRISRRERKWLLDELRPAGFRSAKTDGDYVFATNTIGWSGGRRQNDVLPLFYKCAHFNEETGECGSHEDLPETCSAFPWDDEPPEPQRVLPPECAYNSDIGRPIQLTRKLEIAQAAGGQNDHRV